MESELKQKLDKHMNVIKRFDRPITNFLNPISGVEEENLTTYILGFRDEEEAEEFDNEIANWEDEDYGPGMIEHYLNYRIVQIIPTIGDEEEESVLSENKAVLIQNAALASLATIEVRKAFLWLFEHIGGTPGGK